MKLPTEIRPLAAFAAAAAIACADAPQPAPDSAEQPHHNAAPMRLADPDLVQACDSIEIWTRAAVTRDVERHDGQLTAGLGRQARWGCRLAAADTLMADVAQRPLDLLRQLLTARGWTLQQEYVADSPDGGMIGMRRATLLCVLQHYWETHSDDERAAQPTEPYMYALDVECFRNGLRTSP